jgi:hypothetical protein
MPPTQASQNTGEIACTEQPVLFNFKSNMRLKNHKCLYFGKPHLVSGNLKPLKMIKHILFLSILFSAYAFGQDPSIKEGKIGHNKTAILKGLNTKLGGNINLSKQDLVVVEELLVNCISTSNSGRDTKDAQYLMSLENYNRQYIPFIKDEQKFVLVNCFCDNVKRFPKWKKEVITIYDGGSCYFTVLMNLTKMEYSNLYINGVG